MEVFILALRDLVLAIAFGFLGVSVETVEPKGQRAAASESSSARSQSACTAESAGGGCAEGGVGYNAETCKPR